MAATATTGPGASGNFYAKSITKGATPEQTTELYNKWAENDQYQKFLDEEDYQAPRLAGEAVERISAGERNLTIIDVAAGTGRAGEELKKRGFTNIDALEPSTGMLKEAIMKKTYKRIYTDFFNEDVQCLQTNSYDVMTVIGAVGEAHIEYTALKEMVRIVKPGGFVVIISSSRVFLQWLHLHVEDEIKRLEEAGLWKRLEARVFPGYLKGMDGMVHVLQVTKSV